MNPYQDPIAAAELADPEDFVVMQRPVDPVANVALPQTPADERSAR